ncbi:MAG: DUF6498-containing protein [Pseudomonadota bacterium]
MTPEPRAIAGAPMWTGLALIAVNTLPIIGVVFSYWVLKTLLALFWTENLVIGAYGLLRLARIDPAPLKLGFFIVHFGGFCVGHAIMLVNVFWSSTSTRPLEAVHALLATLTSSDAVVALAAIVVSHGWSFVSNFLGRQEFARSSAADAMRAPYRRVMITQLALLVGALLIGRFGEPLLALIALVIVKTAFDWRAHRQEHRSPVIATTV